MSPLQLPRDPPNPEVRDGAVVTADPALTPGRAAEPLKVLIAEDNTLDCELVVQGLVNAGFVPDWHRVDTEAAYLEGLQAGPDLVLSDFQMPRFNGLRALELLKQRGLDIPFILISGTIGEDTAVAAMRHGASDYLLKDRLTRLGPAVRQALAEGRLRRERLQVEAELRSSEQRFRLLAKATNDAIWDWDLRTNACWWNEGLEKLFGYRPDEVAPTISSWTDHLHPSEQEAVVDGIRHAIDHGAEGWKDEYRFLCRDGHYASVLDRGHIIRDEAGRAVRMIGGMTDQTERKRLEQAQVDAAAFVNDVLNSLTSAVAVLDRTGHITATNEVWRRFGRENGGGDSLQQNYLTVCATSMQQFGLADAQAAAEGIQSVLAGTAAEFTLEYPCHAPNERRWFLMKVSPLGDGSRGVVVAHEKITARKQAEEALQRQQAELRVLFDLLPAMICFKNSANVILRANQRMSASVGKSVAEIEGQSAFKIFAHGEASYFADDLKVMQSGTPSLGKIETVQDHTGRDIIIQTNKVPYFDQNGKVIGLVLMSLDITEERLKDAAVRRLASIVEYSADGIVSKTLHGIITSWNPAAEALLGYTAAEIIGQSMQVLIPTDRLNEEVAILAEIANGNPVQHLETIRIRKDGRPIEVAVTVSAIKEANGRTIGASKIFRDIAEHKRASALLAESEKRLALATKAAKIGIWDLDVRTKALIWDAKMQELYGLRAQEFTGGYDAWQKGLHPEDRTRAEDELARAIEGGRQFNTEFRIVWPGGQVRNIEAHAEVQRAHDGSVTHLIGVNWDITDRRLAEKALRESEAMLRLAGRTARLGGWAVDLPGSRVTWSDEVCAILEMPVGTVPGLEQAFDFYTLPSRPAIVEAMEAAVQRGLPFDLELEVVTAKERPLWVRCTGEARADAAGAITRVHGAFQDITARKLTEATLRESDERFRQLIENVSDVIVVVDAAGGIVFLSPSAQRVMGYTNEETIGHPFTKFIHPEDQAKAREGLQRAFGGIPPGLPVEYRLRHRDGTWRLFQANGRAMADATGAAQVVVNSRDITETRKLEEQFLRAQRLEAVGTLSSGIAHDLNNILAPILLIAPMLKEKRSDPQDDEMLTMIEKAAQRGAEIIKQLLTFSRGIEGERGPVQIRHILTEMAVLMRETFPRQIKIMQQIAPDLSSVNADATQIHQVLVNLCINARDAMPSGGKLTVTAENVMVDEAAAAREPMANAGSYVCLTVSDTGEGIPRENLARIFEPFFTTKEVGKGTGLGLSTARGIVKSHGGFITVYSEPDRGTSFKVYLPGITDGRAAELTGKTIPPWGAQELVLVVDDEPAIRRALSLALENGNYRVLVAADGREAMSLFLVNRENIRLVLTDIMMPGMNGVALIRALRALEPRLRFVAASGLHDQDRREELAALGVTFILAKPCSPRDILKTVQSALAVHV